MYLSPSLQRASGLWAIIHKHCLFTYLVHIYMSNRTHKPQPPACVWPLGNAYYICTRALSPSLQRASGLWAMHTHACTKPPPPARVWPLGNAHACMHKAPASSMRLASGQRTRARTESQPPARVWPRGNAHARMHAGRLFKKNKWGNIWRD